MDIVGTPWVWLQYPQGRDLDRIQKPEIFCFKCGLGKGELGETLVQLSQCFDEYCTTLRPHFNDPPIMIKRNEYNIREVVVEVWGGLTLLFYWDYDKNY